MNQKFHNELCRIIPLETKHVAHKSIYFYTVYTLHTGSLAFLLQFKQIKVRILGGSPWYTMAAQTHTDNIT